MLTQHERLVALRQKLELIVATQAREMPVVMREVDELIRLTAENPTVTLPAGMLCAGPDVWHQEDDEPQPAEAVDSSAAIPAHVIERLDRCAE